MHFGHIHPSITQVLLDTLPAPLPTQLCVFTFLLIHVLNPSHTADAAGPHSDVWPLLVGS